MNLRLHKCMLYFNDSYLVNFNFALKAMKKPKDLKKNFPVHNPFKVFLSP